MNELQDAALFYRNKILPNVYIFTLYDGRNIIVYPEEWHFKHLTGIQHLNNLSSELLNIIDNPRRFLRGCLNGELSKEDFLSDEYMKLVEINKVNRMFKFERWFDCRIKYFKELFGVLDNNEKIIKFNKIVTLQPADTLLQEADYFKFEISETAGKYIGIKKDNGNLKNKYFCFSTLIYEEEIPSKYKENQSCLEIKNYLVITKQEFVYRKKEFDEMNILRLPTKSEINQAKQRISKFLKNEIRKLLNLLDIEINKYDVSILLMQNAVVILTYNTKELCRYHYNPYKTLNVDSVIKSISQKVLNEVIINAISNLEKIEITFNEISDVFQLIYEKEPIYEFSYENVVASGDIEKFAKQLKELM